MGRRTNLRTSLIMAVVLLALSVFTSSVFATGSYNGGNGVTPETAFQINTAEQLDEIGQHPEDWSWGYYFILTADIDLSGYTGTAFNIIGNSGTPFNASFNGNGYTIYNFTYTSTVADVGLFGYVGSGGEIKNLGMTNVNVNAGSSGNAGGLVGRNYDGTVSNCYATGSVSGYYQVGGLVGRNDDTVSNCYATCTVTGNNRVGGLMGSNYGTVLNCYATGTVIGTSYHFGGLLGENVGQVSNCYAAGSVSGIGAAGLVGSNSDMVTNSFWDIYTSGQTTSAGGTGKTTAEMWMKSTFTDHGWDFTTPIWKICNYSDYPRLAWQSGLCDCNGNGISDPVDVANGTSLDCNFNGTPDECEYDCDSDGIPDECEPDSDGDGVPNDCDICLGDNATGDSDADGICDDIDICPGGDDNIDTDGDGVPNGCDICPGGDDNTDTDGDGIPDDCDDDVIYVDAGRPGGGNGRTWATAYKYLQDALSVAISGEGIYVAEGVYKPDEDEAGNITPGDREATFQLVDNVAIYGGFQSGGSDFADRDPNQYKTILSGDLNGGDIEVADPCDLLDEPTRAENSYHVVTGSGTDGTAVLDGFIITGGNANDDVVLFENCLGGGMYSYRSNPTVTNCTFSANSAFSGGGMFYEGGGEEQTVTNCTFIGNSAITGGGMYNSEGPYNVVELTVTNCTFSGNYADYSGGGMQNSGIELMVTNCTFSGNSAQYYGGGMYNYYFSSPMVTNCTFSGNSSVWYGGGMANYRSSTTLTNCVLWGNTTDLEGPQLHIKQGTLSISYCDVQGGQGAIYNDSGTINWGAGNIGVDPLFVNANGPDDIIGNEDDNLRLLIDSPCINAGDNTSVPLDTADLDDDGDTSERTPLDLDGDVRVVNGIVDMGAYEYGALIFVDESATGDNNGSSWSNAFNHLQDALSVVTWGDEIYVAQGIYKPDEDTANPGGSGDRMATFQLINGMAICGGFQSGGGAWEERDPQVYKTILSGDLNGNDIEVAEHSDLQNEPTRAENSYHVVSSSGTDETAVLDGFIVTAGNANGVNPYNHGGGMNNNNGSPTVTNCTFSENSAGWFGGGMYNYDNSNPTVTNCSFSGNSAYNDGGGMCNWIDSSPRLTNCFFNGNSANSGGGMYSYRSNLTVTNCMFSGNSIDYSGGGMNNFDSSPTVTNCTFIGNSAARDGGGIYSYLCNTMVTNCTFSGNSALSFGGGMCDGNSISTLTNCTFAGNSALSGNAMAYDSWWGPRDPSNVWIINCILWDDGDEIWNNDGSTITVTYSCVQDEDPDDGSVYQGTGNIDDDPMFVDADGADNTPGTEDDNLRLLAVSLCLDAGDNTAVPADTADLDDDGDTSERTPLDLDGRVRVVNGIVDMGAYEYRRPTIHVDANASPGGDGTTWATAYKYLQEALYKPATIVDEIWVAEGVYKPDEDEGGNVTPGDREATFQLINGVAIYGGFPSGGGAWEDRDPQVYKTTLSGDLNGNDIPVADPCDLQDEPTRAENSYRVVIGSGTDASAILDGFTITGGNANGYQRKAGGGMLNSNGSPTITACTFTGNSAESNGGGMYNQDSSPTLANCTFSGNSTSGTYSSGGGMSNFDSSPVMTGCEFTDNLANWKGGGICNYGGNPTLTNCTFSGNSANGTVGSGGGMYNSGSNVTLMNCMFSGNSAESSGGGMQNTAGNSTVTNCTFSGNSAESYGGGMANSESSPTLTNCMFIGNSAAVGGGGMKNSKSSPTLIGCTLTGNSSKEIGGGMHNYESNPTLTNCTFIGNSAEHEGGGMYSSYGSLMVTNCTFIDNSAVWHGGGMYNNGSDSNITNCTFSGNSTEWGGGGMYSSNGSSTVTNCTFSGNFADYYGGGIHNGGGNPTITNCILWGNTALVDGNEIALSSSSTVYVSYCDVKGGQADVYVVSGCTLNWGVGNIDNDPMFVDANGPDDIIGTEDDDLRLLPGSPCIDAGDNTAVPSDIDDLDGDGDITEPIPFDLDGNRRIGDGDNSSIATVDMGAYEFILDTDGDGIEEPIDTAPAIYSNEFSDAATTSGTITDRGDQILFITDELDPDGVRIKANPAGGIIPASVSVCGGQSTVTFDAGDEAVVTCGSVEIKVISGIVEITLVPVAGPAMTTSLAAGNNLAFEATTFTLTAPSTNSDVVVLLVQGDKLYLAPGETLTLNQPPVANAGDDQIVEQESYAGTKVTLDGSSSTDPDSTPGTNDDIVSFDWYEGDTLLGSGETIDYTFPLGSHTVTLLVTDSFGETDKDEVIIVVQDTTPPVITCPADVMLECPADTSPAATGSAGATDNCDPSPTVVFSDLISGACPKIIERTWTATDATGNSSSCVQVITVVDTTPPVITCPPDVILECPADTSVTANGSATATDACGNVTVTYSDTSVPGFENTEVISRTWTATDECGNSSSCVQTITVVDVMPPEFEFSVTPTVLWPANHKMVLITPTWTASDKCDASPEVSLVSISVNEANDAKGAGNTSEDIQVGDDGSIYLRAERSGSGKDRVYTITYQAVDDCGNATIRNATVTVPHDKRSTK